jgi:hypothetical protein
MIMPSMVSIERSRFAISALQAGFLRTISVPDGAPPPGERSRDDLEASTKYDWLNDLWPLLTRERVEKVNANGVAPWRSTISRAILQAFLMSHESIGFVVSS